MYSDVSEFYFVLFYLYRFIGYQFLQRNSGLCVTLRVCRFLVRIPDCQNINRLQIIRQPKLPAYHIRLKITYPHRAKTGFRCLQHHMVCQYGGIYVGSFLFIERAYPCLSMVSADNDCQRCSV